MGKAGTVVIVAIGVLVGFLMGTFYGFKQGYQNFSLLDEIARGALATYNLSYIENDRIDLVEFSSELAIDAGLHRYILYRESGNKLLSEWYLSAFTTEIDRYVDIMAERRKSHPMVFGPSWADPIAGDDDEARAWRENERLESEQMVADIKGLLRERGVSESALAKQPDPPPENP